MTLDEAIKHAEEVAKEKENEGKLLCQSEAASIGCLTCAEEHRQLAKWLKDYKRLLEQKPKTGHWIKRPYGFKCSRCLVVHKYYHPPIYCPTCGAKMIESQERNKGKEKMK